MNNNIIQSYYKRNDLNHIEELIMRVTNYAWSEMTLLQQGELRENAAAELAAMQARIEKLETALKEIDETLSGNLPITSLVKEIAKEALK